MADVWLPGFDRVDAGPDGGTFARTDLPWRLVLHTTEGASIAGAVAAYRSAGSPPHITVDPSRQRRAQHVPLNRSAYALRNMPGGVETNRVPLIQVEIVGYAAESHLWPGPWLDWLGLAMLRPLLERLPIRLDHPRFLGAEYGRIASASAPQRMTFAAWNAFAGICGHQHVPENDHWDPGRLDVDRMISAAFGSAPSPDPGAPDDMKLKLYKTEDTGPTYDLDGQTWAGAGAPNPSANQVWIVGESRRPAGPKSSSDELVATGQLDPVVYPVQLATLRGFPRLPGS